MALAVTVARKTRAAMKGLWLVFFTVWRAGSTASFAEQNYFADGPAHGGGQKRAT